MTFFDIILDIPFYYYYNHIIIFDILIDFVNIKEIIAAQLLDNMKTYHDNYDYLDNTYIHALPTYQRDYNDVVARTTIIVIYNLW